MMIEVCTYPSNCLYASQGATKPDPPVVYTITGVKAQNVRSGPRLNALAVDSIPALGKDGEPIAYPVYWQMGDWLALDNDGTRWVASWLGRIDIHIYGVKQNDE